MSFNNSPTLEQAITTAFWNALADVMGAMAAKVVRVDPNGLIAAQPMVQKMTQAEDGSWISEDYPTINGVLVFSLGAGDFRLTFPVAVGDEVLLVCSSSSLERWKQVGSAEGPVDPMDPRRFNINDMVAVPGLRSLASAWAGQSPDAATLGKSGGPQAVFRAAGIELGGNAAMPATEQVILGNVRKALEDSFLTSLQTQFTAAAAGATSLAAGATAQVALCIGPLAPLAPGFTAMAGGATSEAAAFTAAAAAVGVMKAGLLATLSNIVKVK